MYVCEYCGKSFSKRYNLNRHQKTAIYCLEKQNDDSSNFACKHCKKAFTRKDNLIKHIRKYHPEDCEDDDCDPEDEEKPEREGVLEKVVDIMKEMQQQNTTAIKDMQKYNKEIINKLFGILDNRSTRNTCVDKLSPITDDDLAAYLDNLSLEFIRRGVQGYADYAGSYPFKGKIICTDRSRKKIQYKNEDGTIASDGRALAQRFFQAIEKKNTAIINTEYSKLQKQLQEIIDTNNTSDDAVADILRQATFIQNMLIKIQNAAQGKDEEFTQMFLLHLSKKI